MVRRTWLITLALLLAGEVHARSGSVNANGTLLSYEERGRGPPVILVHGSITDQRDWGRQVRALSRSHRVIAYSRRYHPPNPSPTGPVDASIDRQVEDLLALILTLRTGPAHLVGQSFGGAIVLEFARRYPGQVRSLVLAEPSLRGLVTTPEVTAERDAVASELAEAFASGDAERIARTYASRVAPGVYDTSSRAFRRMLQANAGAFQLDFRAARPTISCDYLSEIRAPTLIMVGDRSPPTLQSNGESAARCLPNGQFMRLTNATHWLSHDQPAAFTSAVRNFLDR